MLGYIIRLVFLIIVVMIGINIFMPERANEIISSFSTATNMEETKLKEGLDKATDFTQDTLSEVSEIVKKKFDDEEN